MTFLGHSSALIEMNGLNILADPHLNRHILFFLWRRSKLAIRIRDLPPIDLILISHGHYDHLDLPTLRKLPRETPVIAPPGLRTVLKWAKKDHIIIRRRWESYTLGEVTVTAVPAKHFSGRPPLFPVTGYIGHVIEGDATVYFAGDSAIFDGMSKIGSKWNVDVALLPIGAYDPPSFRRHHMSPEDAVEACRMLQAKAMVPIHWGAFRLSLEPLAEPLTRLRLAGRRKDLSSKIKILEPGHAVSVGGDGAVHQVETPLSHAASGRR